MISGLGQEMCLGSVSPKLCMTAKRNESQSKEAVFAKEKVIYMLIRIINSMK